MSGDHLNKLSMSTSVSNLNNGTNHHSSSTSSIMHQNSFNTKPANNSHNPVKLVHALSPLNHRYVKLNVGGRLFSTSMDTLTRQDNMLRAMFSGRIDVSTDSDGYILIDRCGRHFEFILNYLRDEDSQGLTYYMDGKEEADLYDLLKEAKFYCIQSIVNAVEMKIFNNKGGNSVEPYFGSSIVSMVTSKGDLHKILSSSEKPFIRLLINRHNNKYSYTNNSDDNLLKNIELFERMSIKFKNRIMFIKDTTSTEEICCWYFHGNSKKIAEVCCTSIVYTTEKKQTKVEFPDSKILEEIFVNAVLFESKEINNNRDESHQNSTADEELTDENMPRLSINNNGVASNCVASLAAAAGVSNQNGSGVQNGSNNGLMSTSTLAANLILSQNSSSNQIGINGTSSNLQRRSNR